MISVFSIFPNRLAIYRSDRPDWPYVYIPYWADKSAYSGAVVRTTYVAKASNQVAKTLGGETYIYTFGDAPGTFNVVAIGALFTANGCGTDKYQSTVYSMAETIDILRRISLNDVVVMAMGLLPIFGVMESATIEVDSSRGTVISSMTFSTLPVYA